MKIKAINFEELLLFIGAAILPLYPFESGGLQPTHAVLAAFAGVTLVNRGVPSVYWSIAFLGLFLHSFFVEAVYVFLGGEPKFIINSIFFLFNLILSCALYQFVRQNGLSTLVPGIIIAAGIALVTILNTGVDLRGIGEPGRATGTFNNPNQLGFFSVCLLSITYLFYRSGSVGYWFAAGLFAVALFLSISSLSKAAMIANFVVIIIALKPASSRNAIFGWSAGTLAATIIIYQLFQGGAFDEYLFMERILNMANESDSSLESRGYFAILQGNALQLLLGLGTQGVDDIVGHEVHSTFGSVLNNYGLVGFAFFLMVWIIWCTGLWRQYGLTGLVCLIAPVMLYGITHNGVRFTIFWLLFAASLAMAQRRGVTHSRPGPTRALQNNSLLEKT